MSGASMEKVAALGPSPECLDAQLMQVYLHTFPSEGLHFHVNWMEVIQGLVIDGALLMRWPCCMKAVTKNPNKCQWPYCQNTKIQKHHYQN